MAENSEISTLCSFHLNDFVFQEGNWVWENSGVPFENGYTNWASGNPDNHGGNQECLVVDKSDKKWRDTWCDNNRFKPLCQIDA